MEGIIIISGFVSLIALIVFFVTCNTIGHMRDYQKALAELIGEQARKQNKHNEYVEKVMFDIKELLNHKNLKN